MFQIAVVIIVASHLGFLVFVVGGGLLACRWPRMIWLHGAAVLWGVLIVTAHWDCPLTWLERRARAAAGMAPLPSEGFIAHYLTGVLYPAKATTAVEAAVLLIVAGSWILFARKWLHRSRYRRGARALIIVDIQNDFCAGGAIPVPGAIALAHDISRFADSAAGQARYSHVVATQDWHIDPGPHFSDQPDFATSWPPHCVAQTAGAAFPSALSTTRIAAIFKKGAYSAGYSGFDGLDEQGNTLADWLRQRDVRSVDVVGVATEHCVRHTAQDAVRAGFATAVLTHLTAGVAADSTAAAVAAMRTAGVRVLN